VIDPEKIRRRVAGLDTENLLMWADNAASGIQRQLDDYRRKPDEAHLAEIKLAAVSMDFVVDELAERLRKEQKPLDESGHAG